MLGKLKRIFVETARTMKQSEQGNQRPGVTARIACLEMPRDAEGYGLAHDLPVDAPLGAAMVRHAKVPASMSQ